MTLKLTDDYDASQLKAYIDDVEVPINNNKIELPTSKLGNFYIKVYYKNKLVIETGSYVEPYNVFVSAGYNEFNGIPVYSVLVPEDATGTLSLFVWQLEKGIDSVVKANYTYKTNENNKGNYTIQLNDLEIGNYYVFMKFVDDKYGRYDDGGRLILVNHPNIEVTANSTDAIVKLPDGATGEMLIIADGEISYLKNISGGANIPLSKGDHEISIYYSGDSKYSKTQYNTTVTLKEINTTIQVSDAVKTYNIAKNLIITLNDVDGNALANRNVTVKVGNTFKNITTDNAGRAVFAVSNLAPKTYQVSVSFDGDANYAASSGNVKIVVKKANPKITAKAKTFKAKTKTKKYSVTLKSNTGKVLKKAKVTIKVKGKTYKATTNAKGKATFKITKLVKKGTYKATVKSLKTAYYNSVSKKVTIKVK